jgi:hypothetical protein
MVIIEKINARRYSDQSFWTGRILFNSDNRHYERILAGVKLKNYFKKQYPNSKNGVRVHMINKHSSRSYRFEISFKDPVEEAQFIIGVKNLEGLAL